MRHLPTCTAFILLSAGLANAATPRVVITSPDNGEIDVAPDLKEIRVEFDQPMDSRGHSIVGGGDNFPSISGELKWFDNKTFVIPVNLQPEHQYQLSINSDTFKGFCSEGGQAAEWYPLAFRTRAAGAAPAKSSVTPEQNKRALAALGQAIDQDYAYRDMPRIDWAKEIARRRQQFENARSANEFARLAAPLLRLAEDAHVWVEAADVRIATRVNSELPNFNIQWLQHAVPQWAQASGGIVTGRFDGGIDYVAFSQCSNQQADAFDKVLDGLHDSKALVLDARFNGGGDETAAQRVAGRFVQKAAVYSRDRTREGGKWAGPFDRVIEPRQEAKSYTMPVAVLIGPKIASSAESFVLMMKCGAKATLVGGVTSGSSGRPMPHDLGNGVTVYLSSWEDQLPDGTLLQNHGVRPDIAVEAIPGNLKNSDPVLEAAIKALRADGAGR